MSSATMLSTSAFAALAIAACAAPSGAPELDERALHVGTPITAPLRIQDGRFHAGDTPIRLAGIGGTAGYNHDYGWPWIDPGTLARLESSHGNFVHFRLGPEIAPGFAPYRRTPGGRFDLEADPWDPGYWTALRDRIADAGARGIYVEIDLIDAWSLEEVARDPDDPGCVLAPGCVLDPSCVRSHSRCHSPWHADNNVQGLQVLTCEDLVRWADRLADPGPEQAQKTQIVRGWLEEVAHQVGGFPNVVFQVGNETFDCDGRGSLVAWEAWVAETVRARLAAPRLFSTNSGSCTDGPDECATAVVPGECKPANGIEHAGFIDYVNRHVTNIDLLAPLHGLGKPVAVNESNCNQSLTPDQYRAKLRDCRITYHLWFGGGLGDDYDQHVQANLDVLASQPACNDDDDDDDDGDPCNGDGDCDEDAGETLALCPDECDVGDGCPATASPQSFTVSEPRFAGQAITLHADLSAISPGLPPLWDLGTGEHRVGSPLTVTYATPGTYTIVLTSNDLHCGTTVLTAQSVTLQAMPPLSCGDVAAQSGYTFYGCGTWEQNCDNHPGTGPIGTGWDCLSTVCCGTAPPPPPQGPSCGAMGGDYCSPSAGWCPWGHQDLGASYDCASCCDWVWVDPCASDATHDHGGGCGAADECGHTFGNWDDCGCPGAPTVWETCWDYRCDEEWRWTEQWCTGSYWTHDWCESCWDDCYWTNWDEYVCEQRCGWNECNWSEQTYDYVCGGWWEVVPANCGWYDYACNPHQC